jgi:hypothetical protein
MNFDWIFDWVFSWVFVGLFYVMLFGMPVVLIWGWMRWWKQDKKRSLIPIMSLIGFALATASALLAISTEVYAKAIGGFIFYDPTLLRIYRYGVLFSLSGIMSSFVGLWRTSALRWHAPVCSVGTLMYWFMMASSE